MSYFNIVAETNENTVVTEYKPERQTDKSYQSEADLEAAFIKHLEEQGYTYLPIHQEADLTRNLRASLERLNGVTFSDAEWKRFFNASIANANDGIVEKTRKIQEDYLQELTRDDGTHKNIRLIDKKTSTITAFRSSTSTKTARRRAPNTTTATTSQFSSTACLSSTSSSSAGACRSARPSTRLSATSATPSGPAPDFLSTSRFS